MARIYTHQNLVGLTFTRLTVTSLSHVTESGSRYWNCQCTCGGTRAVRGDALKQGKVKSCGCLWRETAAITARSTAHLRRKCRVIQPGQVFGKLTTLDYAGDVRVGWNCRCECGGTRKVRTSDLTKGQVTSCGCEWKMNVRGALHQRNFTHGLSNTPGYYNWKAMCDRCTNHVNPAFEKYSKIGICDGLKSSPKVFLDAVGEKPTPKHEVDRINNKDGYHCGSCAECLQNQRPLNVRWATRKEQLRNRSNNVLFCIDGVTHCASEWAENLGLTRNQFMYRYREHKVTHA